MEKLQKSSDSQKLRVETPLGTLVAYPSTDSSYPGIYIDLHRDGHVTDAPLVLVEYTETEGDADDKPHLITRAWKEVTGDEYSDRVIHEKIEPFFNEFKAKKNRKFIT